MDFPYREEDLMGDIAFRQMCKKKGYPLQQKDLEYYIGVGLIHGIETEYGYTNYSKFQFYVVKYIIDNRYQTNGFIRTYHNFQGLHPEKVFNFFDERVKKFDKNFREEYQYRFIEFFKLYYRMSEYCKPLFETLNKSIKKSNPSWIEINKKIADRTFLKNFYESYIIKNIFELSDKEKDVIQWFMITHMREYRSLFEIYLGNTPPERVLQKIPEYAIVKDFMEIFNVIEVIENITGEELKQIGTTYIGSNKLSPSGSLTYCNVCGKEFIKRKKNNITCSEKCAQENKNIRKKYMRKKDKEYGK